MDNSRFLAPKKERGRLVLEYIQCTSMKNGLLKSFAVVHDVMWDERSVMW